MSLGVPKQFPCAARGSGASRVPRAPAAGGSPGGWKISTSRRHPRPRFQLAVPCLHLEWHFRRLHHRRLQRGSRAFREPAEPLVCGCAARAERKPRRPHKEEPGFGALGSRHRHGFCRGVGGGGQPAAGAAALLSQSRPRRGQKKFTFLLLPGAARGAANEWPQSPGPGGFVDSLTSNGR